MTIGFIIAAVVIGWVLFLALIITFMRGAAKLRREEEAGTLKRRMRAREARKRSLEDVA